MQFKTIMLASLLLFLGCAVSKPINFIETNGENRIWKTINLHNNYSIFSNKNYEVWQRIVDILSKEYTFKVEDRTSGYIKTAWKNISTNRYERYRNRIFVKMSGNQIWSKAKMKVETEWWDDSEEKWITGYDKNILSELYKDLQGRVGTSIK